MLGNMMEKLQEMQQKMKESKERLGRLRIEAEAGNNAVKVVVNGNREVRSIEIEPSMCLPERREELEDFIVIALNRALKLAEASWETEMRGNAGGLLSNIKV